jgi:phospholipid/cholesterol/gamma-HCH transport system permease protein
VNGATRERFERLSGSTEAAGEITRFSAYVLRDTLTLKVFHYLGESLRQAGILITGSMLVVVGLMFTIGTTCGIESAFFNRATGSPSYAGIFAALCDLREAGPYAFGYMFAAKVGTGIVAEIGAMRVGDEVDALEVMGIDSLVYLCATRLLACWLVIPFIYVIGLGASYIASYIGVIYIVGDTAPGGYNLIFWFFQSPTDLLFSLIKGMAMATMIILVGAYYGYTAKGGPVGVGEAAAKSMVFNVVGVHVIGMLGTLVFWGTDPRAPIGG